MIFSFSPKTFRNTTDRRQLILQRLLENKLYAKAEKYDFHSSKVSFLGFVMERGQVKTDAEKVCAVAEWRQTDSQKNLQRFLGFANFYRRLSRISVMWWLLSLNLPLLLSSLPGTLKQTLPLLKQLFTSAPVLRQPAPSQQFIVEVDASDSRVRAIMSQRFGPDNRLYLNLIFFFAT